MAGIAPIAGNGLASPLQPGGRPAGTGFGQELTNALSKVNALQNAADAASVAVADGTAANFHDLAIAMAQADVALQLTVAVRNRVVDAYRQIMQMQI